MHSLEEKWPGHCVSESVTAVEERVQVGQEAVAYLERLLGRRHHLTSHGHGVLVLGGRARP